MKFFEIYQNFIVVDNKSRDVAHSIGVQNGFYIFFCLQEPIFDVLVIFFVLKLGVRLPCEGFIDS